MAAILGDLAVEFVQNIDPNQATSAEEWMELMVQVHRMRGIAYGIYALQSMQGYCNIFSCFISITWD